MSITLDNCAVLLGRTTDPANDGVAWSTDIEDNALPVQLIILDEYLNECALDDWFDRSHSIVCQRIAAGC